MEEDFKFDLLKRKQLIKIIDGYNLKIDKSLSTKKLLEAIKEHLEVTDDGYIVEKKSGSGRKKLDTVIKYLS